MKSRYRPSALACVASTARSGDLPQPTDGASLQANTPAQLDAFERVSVLAPGTTLDCIGRSGARSASSRQAPGAAP